MLAVNTTIGFRRIGMRQIASVRDLMESAALEEARRRVRDALRERGSLTVADVRQLLGAPRRSALAILTWLDAEGVTRGRGDERVGGPRAIE